MPKPKPTKPKPTVFMTPAELRGEASYLVLKLVLARLAQSECKRIHAESILEAEQLDIDDLTHEIECLFPEYEAPSR